MHATLFPVWKLTDNVILHHKNHICHTNNWYTSLALIVLSLDLGIHGVGTVKGNKKGLPTDDGSRVTNKKLRSHMVISRTNIIDNNKNL